MIGIGKLFGLKLEKHTANYYELKATKFDTNTPNYIEALSGKTLRSTTRIWAQIFRV